MGNKHVSDERKKLAVVVTTMNIGGAQKVIIDLGKALDKEKYRLKLFVHSDYSRNQFTDELLAAGIDVEYIHRDAHVTLKSYRLLSRALSAYKPDYVHIHLDTVYAPVWAMFHKKKTLFTMHSQPYRIFNNSVVRGLFRWLVKRKNFILTGVSRQVSSEAEKLLRIKPGCIVTVYNPVKVINEIKRDTSGTVRFVNVARFYPIKNHELLIRSFGTVCEKYPEAVLKLGGDGHTLEKCRALVKELKLEKNIFFLGNVVDVYSLLSDSDVFVLSSDSEAMPISILEAIACSLPVVSTAVGGVPEIVKENGILVEAGNAEQLSEAMIKMIENPDVRRDFCHMSHNYAEAFDAEKIANEYIGLFESME